MKVALTDRAIARAAREAQATGKRIDLSDAGHRGLALRITPAGNQSWVLYCRDATGRPRRFPLGPYGDVPARGIREARAAADALRVRVRHEGADPIGEARQERLAAQAKTDGVAGGRPTLTSLLDLYERQHGKSLKSWARGRRRLELVFGSLLVKPLSELTIADLQLTADDYLTPGQAAFGVRVLRPVLKWAAHPGRRYVAAELGQLRDPATAKQRHRVLSPEELAVILPCLQGFAAAYAAARRFAPLAPTVDLRTRWRYVDLQHGVWLRPVGRTRVPVPLSADATAVLRELPAASPSERVFRTVAPNSAVMMFLLLTLARLSEAALARWRDVDLVRGIWTIPETKSGVPHLVPLSRQATAFLRMISPGRPEDLVFGAVGTGAPAGNWDRECGGVHTLTNTEGWHRHDLRRTGASLLGEMGEPPHVVEATLNHVAIAGRLAATYNTARYRPEVSAALQRLADRLDGIAAGGAELHQLARRVGVAG